MLSKELQKTFGLRCKISPVEMKGLPLYMVASRKFYHVEMEGSPFLLVELPEDDRFGAIALKKQQAQYAQKTGMDVAFSFSHMSKNQRDALIEKKIPFVTIPGQIYLPFLGVSLSGNMRQQTDSLPEKMMPATQCLFLYMLYGKKEYVLKKSAAEDLGFTKTSITRASEQLKNFGLIEEKRFGREIRMFPVAKGRDFLERARKCLINPVQSRICADNPATGKMFLAGESSLSRHSMLAEPANPTYAIFKAEKADEDFREIDSQWQESAKLCTIEFWKYDPALFAVNGEVDPVSLAMSLCDCEDERIRGELETYLEEYAW